MFKIIEAKNLSHTYLPGSVYEHPGLKDINFSLYQGEVLGLFGLNGSGKSTLARHLNGLLIPTEGTISVCGINTSDPKGRKDLWQKAGLVFQYPEQQIFQISIYDEIAYGPRNLGLPENQVHERVLKAMKKVGLNKLTNSLLVPISLSGGLRRRVAIAGMLSIEPELLILDEPMAGLDFVGRKLIIELIKKRRENNETTVIISHNLKEIITAVDKIGILDKGSLIYFGDVNQLLTKTEILKKYHFELPEILQIKLALVSKGIELKEDINSIPELGEEIIQLLNKRKKDN